jgi:hypothetical protein
VLSTNPYFTHSKDPEAEDIFITDDNTSEFTTSDIEDMEEVPTSNDENFPSTNMSQ